MQQHARLGIAPPIGRAARVLAIVATALAAAATIRNFGVGSGGVSKDRDPAFRRIRPGRLCAALAATATAMGLHGLAGATPYQPAQLAHGDVRIWGSPDDGPLIAQWSAAFAKLQPDVRVIATLHGPESTMAGIYTGVADLSLIGRELRLPVDNMAFEWVKLHKPTVLEIANASLTAPRQAVNLAVFVNPANPVAGLTLAQLDGIFGAEHRRAPATLHTWGDVGLQGEWRDRTIRVIAPPVESIPALYFRKTVLKDSYKWNPVLEEVDSAARAVAIVAADPAAIVYAPMPEQRAGVKAVPLAASADAPFVTLTPATAADRSYPMARTVHVAFDRDPARPLAPPVNEFLRFVLSDEGQAAVAREGSYVPLLAASAQQQLKKLDGR